MQLPQLLAADRLVLGALAALLLAAGLGRGRRRGLGGGDLGRLGLCVALLDLAKSRLACRRLLGRLARLDLLNLHRNGETEEDDGKQELRHVDQKLACVRA